MSQARDTATSPSTPAMPHRPRLAETTPIADRPWKPPAILVVAILGFAILSSLGGVFGGPALGDHEAIVAQSAREMRLSGDWLVPQFLGTPFFRKSPLPFWLVAASSYLFSNDPTTGLPVTVTASRLPSALCSLGTILLLWRLGSCMFGRRTGLVTAIVASSSVVFLLYAPNATAEMPLTFCCVWAYYHFWFAATAPSRRGRIGHSLGFYLALGFAMLAKGPAPVALVGFPLAVWWYVHRPLRVIAGGGAGAWRQALGFFIRDFGARTLAVFTRHWFIPGIILFALVFVPWMLAVAERHPQAWDLWNWQFLQRAKGDFPDTRHRSILYYVPILGGLVLPWTFLIVEAAISPWVRRNARMHRALMFAGLWALLGTLSMSLMEFKKPYYILPAVPGLILLIAVAAERVFLHARRSLTRRESWPIRVGVVIQLAAVVGGVWMWLSDNDVAAFGSIAIIAILGAMLYGGAFQAYRMGRGWLALVTIALVTAATFHAVWYDFGSAIDNIDEVTKLASTLDSSQVPRNARLYWADRRPDARLSFYFDRRSEHMVDPAEIVGKDIFNRRTDKHAFEQIAIERALELLQESEPVYLIMGRDSYERLTDTLVRYADLIGTLQEEKKPDRHDWLIVTNASRIPADR